MAARKRFGEICVRLGFISKETLARALTIQKELQAGGMDPPLVGEILLREGFITPEQRDQALEASGEIPADFIPGYEIIGRIGRGARGIVYKARQLSMDRLVALKILPRTVAEDRKYTEKFTREAKSVARLNHPNIISGIDVGEHEGCHYFVMEYVDGTSLASVLRSGPLAVDKGVEIARQVAEALDHAHSHGIVHRDIKPDNIMVTRDGAAKLCDYGLAGQVLTNAPGQRLKKVEGTPHYISPEQAKGLPDIDIRSDLYSLGATVFHIITGEPPFDGGDPVDIMRKHLSEKPPALRERIAGVRPSLQRLMDRLMEKDREKRFQTPRELLDAIARLSKGPRRKVALEAAPLTWAERKKRQLVGAGLGGLTLAVLLGAALVASTMIPPTTPVEPGRGGTAAAPPSTGPTTQPLVPSETTPPKDQPEVPALTREEREAKEAWNRILDMVTSSEETLEDTGEIIKAMEGFISNYDGTPQATQAGMMLTHQELTYERLLDEKYKVLEEKVEQTAGEGDFRAAAAQAKEFKETYDNPSYVLRASNLIQVVEKENEVALEDVDKKSEGLLAEMKFKEAAGLYKELEERSTKGIAEACRERVEEIGTLLAKEERRVRIEGFLGRLAEFVEEDRYEDGIRECDEMLKGEEDEETRSEVEKQRETLGRLAKTYDNLRGNLEGKKGESMDFSLDDGEEWEGRITRVELPSLRIQVKVTGQHGEVSLELSRLSAEMLDALSRSDPSDEEDPLNGTIFFIAKENYPAAKRLFEDALGKAVRVPDEVVRDLDALGKRYREGEAERLLDLATERMAAKAWKGARTVLERVRDEFADTELFRKSKKIVLDALRTCAIEIVTEEGPQAILHGKVERLKNGFYEFTYDFSEAKQLEDWIPDTALFPASSSKHRRDTMEVLGKVDFRCRFKDDIRVEFQAESRALKNPNINVLLNDGAKLGYLFGLGFKPRPEWVSLEIAKAGGQAARRLLLPGNAILRWALAGGDPGGPPSALLDELKFMGLWGEMKPVIEVKKKYRVRVAHAGDVLQFGAITRSRELVRMQETNDGDTGGGVAFIPFGSTMLLHKVEITGRPDPEWLKEEAARQVDSRSKAD